MKTINIDFLAAGCSTCCKHCYVNGGPGPLMPLGDVFACMEKLDEIGKYLEGEASITLDHEPFNHPQVGEIVHAVAQLTNITCYHHGMTTGLGLIRRKDREEAVRSYLDHGYRDFGITIHGSCAHHDEIVDRAGAYDTSVAAAGFLAQMGCKVQISLMLNRYFARDADDISRLLDEVEPDDVWFANPIFTPHARMMRFEPYRADLKTLEAIRKYLPLWHQDEREITDTAYQNSIGAAAARLERMDLGRLWAGEQDELYLSLHQDCRLYAGNSGAETRCLGDLRLLDPAETAQKINTMPGNRDYGAFYDAGGLPAVEDVLKALAGLPSGLVYGDFESVLYRAFTDMGIPTKLLQKT